MKIHAGKKLGETPALFFAGNKSARLLDWNNKIQMGFQSIGYVFIVQVSPNMNMTNTRCIHYVVGVDGWNLGHVWRRLFAIRFKYSHTALNAVYEAAANAIEKELVWEI